MCSPCYHPPNQFSACPPIRRTRRLLCRAAAGRSTAPLWPLPAFARALRFAVAAHAADRLHIVARGFSIVSLLLGSVEQRVVAAALLFNHGSRVFPPVNRPSAFAGSAVFPVRFATPMDCGCAARYASAQKRGERYKGRSIPIDRILSQHVLGLLSVPSSATPLEKQGKIARTWARTEKRQCEPNSARAIVPPPGALKVETRPSRRPMTCCIRLRPSPLPVERGGGPWKARTPVRAPGAMCRIRPQPRDAGTRRIR